MGKTLTRWTPQHEMVLSLHIQGKTNGEIGETVGYSESHVGNIIRSEHGQRIVRAANRRIRRAMEAELDGKIQKAKATALDRVVETLEMNFPLDSDHKKHQDKIAMDYLKSSKTLAGEEAEGTTLNKVGGEVIKMLADALEKSSQVGDDIDEMMGEAVPEIEEAEFELLGESEP